MFKLCTTLILILLGFGCGSEAHRQKPSILAEDPALGFSSENEPKQLYFGFETEVLCRPHLYNGGKLVEWHRVKRIIAGSPVDLYTTLKVGDTFIRTFSHQAPAFDLYDIKKEKFNRFLFLSARPSSLAPHDAPYMIRVLVVGIYENSSNPAAYKSRLLNLFAKEKI